MLPNLPRFDRGSPWLTLAFLAIPVFVGSLDLTVVSAFLPELLTELQIPLDTGLNDASWILSGYLLAYSIGLLVMARLSDYWGRRRVYIACLLAFMLGSVLVASAHLTPTDAVYALLRRLGSRGDQAYVTLQLIIVGRVIQALGAGALAPVSLAIVGDLFPRGRRAQPLGVIAGLDTLGWVLGHLYGGVFVQFMPWQGLFWLNIPLTLIALAAVNRALRHLPPPDSRGRFDIAGAVLIIGALSCLNLGLGGNLDLSGAGFAAGSSWLSGSLPLLFTGALLLMAFVVVERRVGSPLINLALFRQRALTLACVINLAVGYALFIGLVSVPILVNIRLDNAAELRSAALQTGLLLSALTLPMAAAAFSGGWLCARFGGRIITVLGIVVSGFGFALVWQTWRLEISDMAIAGQMSLIGIGIGLTFAPLGDAIIDAAPQPERGAAAGLVILTRLIGMTLSVSSLTAFGVYRVKALLALSGDFSPFDPAAYFDAYAAATAQTLAEMGLIGALVCAFALLLAMRLGGGARLMAP